MNGINSGRINTSCNIISNWPVLTLWQRIFLIVIAVSISLSIAFITEENAHPDESFHIDAFRYFEYNLWPPDLGSDKVLYTKYGWSRVFSGEAVYLIYGKLGKAVRIVTGTDRYLVYRLLNIILFAITLTVLFFIRSKLIDPLIICLPFICIPQVYYIYSYANSDAWGLSISIFLFITAAKLAEKSLRTWSAGLLSLFGVLTGLLLASKINFILSLILPCVLITSRLLQTARQEIADSFRRFGVWVIITGLLIIAIAAPFRIIYPLTQGDFSTKIEEMREVKATDDFKPSSPTFPYYRLASKGVSYYAVLMKTSWIDWTLKSFYGTFGYMNVWNPSWVYRTAGSAAMLLFFMTAFKVIRRWSSLDKGLRACLIISPAVIIINICASLYRTLNFDFQAQGRYLFASFTAFSLLLMWTTITENKKGNIIKITIFFLMYVICIYSLIKMVITNPALR